jgi:uncharacterized membrane protein YkoI
MKYIVLMFLACVASVSQARSFDADGAQSQWLVADSGKKTRISMSEAMERVEKNTGGRVLLAQPVREEGREMYRIKVLTRQGEVRIVYVDPATGSME